jgi:ferredoxin
MYTDCPVCGDKGFRRGSKLCTAGHMSSEFDYTVRIIGSEHSASCSEQTSVLHALARTRQDVVPVGCRGGGCGVCRIQVLRGEYVVKRMSRAHVTAEDEANGTVLACRTWPRSDLEVEPQPKYSNI